MLSSLVLPTLRRGRFPVGYPACLPCPILPHFTILTILGDLYSILNCSRTLSFVSLNIIILSILFSDTFNLYSSLKVRDHFSHLYKRIGNFCFMYSYPDL